MSTVLYSTPVFNKVRHSRRTDEGAAETDPRELDHPGRTRDERTEGPQTQTRPPGCRTSFRSAALVLGALCVLMAAAIIVLSVHHVAVASEKQQLVDVSICYNRSLDDTKPLQAEVPDDNQLQATGECEGESCPEGWRRFGCSCYFRSTGVKTWFLGRKDCQNRGSDLVVITSPEEKAFVRELNGGRESWIGLRKSQSSLTGNQWQWRWVDESPLTEFWAQVHSQLHWAYAVCCNAQGNWVKIPGLKENRSWICERRISKPP